MIVACPLCQTRFLVAAGLFAGGARNVRCGRCRHVWRAELEPVGQEGSAGGAGASDQGEGGGIKAVTGLREPVGDTPLGSLPLPSEMPSATAPAASAVRAKFLTGLKPLPPWARLAGLAALAALLLVALLWGIVDRRDIALRWPTMTKVYDKVGLDSHQPGDGIDFRDVKSELVYDGGILKLTVEGHLANTTQDALEIPHILATAIGSDGGAIQSWRIDAPAATLAPLATVPFRSTINAPREGVVNINLSFVGRKNVAD